MPRGRTTALTIRLTPTDQQTLLAWFCRKFSFEMIWGMISPRDSW